MYEDMLDFGNLYKSLKKCAKGVRWKTSVIGYEWNALKNTFLLKEKILKGQYKIDKYAKFYINEPKKRQIQATKIKDRQFQRSMCDNGLIDELSKSFIYDNCACQNGKGTLFALNRFDKHLHNYYKKYGNSGYTLKCDIKSFFNSLDHNICKQVIDKKVSDFRIKNKVYQIIDSFDGDIGLGLGSQISQYIALSVLDALDHFIKEKLRIKNYIRYMDDFILIHPDKSYLQFCKKEIEKFLVKYKLQLNYKTQIKPIKNGIIFLNWCHKLTDTGKIFKTLNKKVLRRKRHHIKKLVKLKVSNEFISQSLHSWEVYANYGDMKKPILNMIEYKRELLKND